MKISLPNYTQTPNICFDEIFKKLDVGELRVILVIIRQTFGWHKTYDRISLSQLASKTGMDRANVARSLRSLISKNLIEKRKFGEKGKEKCYYALLMEEIEQEHINEEDGNESEEEMELISNNLYQCQGDTPPVSRGHPPSVKGTPTKETNTKETNQKKQQHAAVFFENSKEQIHPYLVNIEIPKVDKIEITKKYDPEIIKNAIEWATHPKNPPKTCLAASIKWACQNKPEVPKNPIYEINENKSYAIKYDGVKNQYAQVYALNNCVEISYIGGQKEAFTLEYEAKGFIEQFKNALRKVQIPLL